MKKGQGTRDEGQAIPPVAQTCLRQAGSNSNCKKGQGTRDEGQANPPVCSNSNSNCKKGQGTRDEGQANPPVCSNSNSNCKKGQGTRDEGQAIPPVCSNSNSHWFDVPEWYKSDLNGIPVNTHKREDFLKEGDHIKDFLVEEISGKKILTGDLTGGLLLVSFTNAYDQLKSEEYDVNAIQFNFLDGMLRQYGDQGLQILMINEVEATGSSRNEETWLNYVWDHQSGKITWINDDSKGTLAGKFGVSQVPSTFLIASDGRILKSWNQLALPAQTAFAIENELNKYKEGQ
jgi:hypothetical protein